MALPRTALAVAVLACALGANDALAQGNAEAYAGHPLGVGRISLRSLRGEPALPASDDAIELRESAGRALYPAFETSPLRQVFRNLANRRRELNAYFLFRGNEPLDLTLLAGGAFEQRLRVSDNPAAQRTLQDLWWQEYVRNRQQGLRAGGYPPVIDNYLMATLSRRLSLPLPPLAGLEPSDDPSQDALNSLLASNAWRLELQDRALVATAAPTSTASLPLPATPVTPLIDYPEAAGEMEIEAIAKQVPVECFYARFGAFGNFQWMRALTEEWGGDLSNLITQRGLNYERGQRTERRLALKENELSKALGAAVISDVALIGLDLYMQEGPAIGLLFEARNNFLLSQSINQQRQEAQRAAPGAKLEDVEIRGGKASLLSTPDQTVRSFYVVSGSYHLVTTSRYLAERFLAAPGEKTTLGDSDGFRYARSVMPVSRGDTILVYLSEAFFRQLTTPHYRIELARRLVSDGELELWQLARVAAAAEGLAVDSLEQLVEAGLLPPGFGQRADGSKLELRDGEWVDSLRGRRGDFIPVPDMTVDKVTPDEAKAYAEFADVYADNWQRLDPIVAAIKREPGAQPSVERVVIDAYVAPISREHYGRLAQILGPPLDNQLSRLPQDAAWFEASVSGRMTGLAPHRLFGAIQGLNLPPALGRVAAQAGPVVLPILIDGYWGATPHAGLVGNVTQTLQRLTGGILGAPVLSNGEFYVASHDRALAEEALANLHFEPAPRPAQLRIRVANLEETKAARIINSLGYGRARKVSDGNAHLLNVLTTQLRAPRDEALAIAERVLDAKLECPLGGEYKLMTLESGVQTWQSTATASQGRPRLFAGAPEGYVFPALRWFRGVELDLLLDEPQLRVHAEVQMQRAEMPDRARNAERTAPESKK
ncbi:MAG: hypothetical protein U0836_09400 [Pirellulales bacterium]